MKTSQILVLAAFGLACVLQLVSILLDKEKLRWGTKCLLMPLLLASMILVTGQAPIFLVAGIIFGFLGDVFLLPEQKKHAILKGIIAFTIGHFFYALAIGKGMILPSIPWIVFAIVLHIGTALFSFKTILPLVKKNKPEVKTPVSIYVLIICLMSAISMIRFLGDMSLQNGVVVIGALCFVLSDFILSFDLFKEKNKKLYFAVMFFYPLAQALIVAGLTWTIAS